MSYPLRLELRAPDFPDNTGAGGNSAPLIAEGRSERSPRPAGQPGQYAPGAPISAGLIDQALERLIELGPPAPWHWDDGEAGPARRRRKGPRPASSETLRMEDLEG